MTLPGGGHLGDAARPRDRTRRPPLIKEIFSPECPGPA
jgi:hypothetical protein